MKGLPFVLLFTAMTFISWGSYGPVLHHGADAFNHDSLRAFVGVGLAYFLIAVIIPMIILKVSGESGSWTMSGAIYSLIAGAVGAVGALGIIMALGYGGTTIYVMPLVFGFAPVVNTLVTAYLGKTFDQVSPIFVAGVVAAALGAGGVLIFKPSPPKAVSQVEVTSEIESLSDSPVSGESAAEGLASTTETAKSDSANLVVPDRKVNFWGVLASIVVAASCWGSYGPMLHIGQGKMSGSRLRPFACVGLSYFFIAVAAPLALIALRSQDAGQWTSMGMTWSFLAGVAGAFGALGVILAFNAGGKPFYVMPLVFGFAPVINTFISLSETGTWSMIQPMFWLSLAVVIAGAVTVLYTAPKPKPKQASHAPSDKPVQSDVANEVALSK